MGFTLKNDNYLNIQGWMINELGLKGNELLVYAVIYGFSQDGATSFGGSLSYLMQWTGASKPTVINCLKSLIDKGLLIKNERLCYGARICEYTAVRISGSRSDNGETDADADTDTADENDTTEGGKEILPGVKNFNRGGKEILPTGKETLPGGKNSLPNNKAYNKADNKAYNKDIHIPSPADGDGACASREHENSNEQMKLSRKQLEAEFESVWTEYPSGRKQDKERAMRAFMAARNGGTAFETIMNGLLAYKKQIEVEHTELRYIKQCGTWFVGKGWQDEYNTEPNARERTPNARNRALNYKQQHYTGEQLKEMGIDFGDDIYESDNSGEAAGAE